VEVHSNKHGQMEIEVEPEGRLEAA
jgi:hypothetical protein